MVVEERRKKGQGNEVERQGNSWAGESSLWLFIFFFCNDSATTEIYTLSLHDALPISFSTKDP